MADNERTLEAKLKFTATDAGAAKKGLADLKKESADLARQVKDLEKATKSKNDAEKAAAEAALKAAKDRQTAIEKEREALEKQIEVYDELEKKAKAATERLAKIKETGDRLKEVSGTLAMGAAAVLGPLTLAANAFLSTANEADPKLQRWNAAMQKIQASTARIGAVVVEQVLPYLEKGALIFEKIAGWAEKNPGAIQAALTVGGALAAAATLTNVVGTLLSTYSTIATLLGAGGGITGIAGSLAAIGPALATAAVTLGPLLIAIIALKALLDSEFGKRGQTAGKQVLAMAAGGAGQLIGGEKLREEWFMGAAKGLGLVQEKAQGAAAATLNQAQQTEALSRAQSAVAQSMTSSTSASQKSAAAKQQEAVAANDVMGASLRNAAAARAAAGPLAQAAAAQENQARSAQQSVGSLNQAAQAAVNNANTQAQAAQKSLSLWQQILNWFSGLKLPGVGKGKAEGGYADAPALYPLAENGRREFVLANQATRAMESMLGAPLTQQKITQMANMSMTANISSDFSARQRAQVREEVRGIFREEFARAYRGV